MPAGCGLSDHANSTAYGYVDYHESPMIIEIAQELGWDKFSISFVCCLSLLACFALNRATVAHSRGGGIAVATAAAFPEFIKATVLLDSWIGFAGNCENLFLCQPLLGSLSYVSAPNQMRSTYDTEMKNRNRQPRVFKSVEAAIEHNMNNPWFPKLRHTAEAIVMRHLQKTGDGKYTFTHDVRTYGQKVGKAQNAKMKMPFFFR